MALKNLSIKLVPETKP
ncbi:hypothetical protein HAZT_HAZT002811, partial [Hyalella azteca]